MGPLEYHRELAFLGVEISLGRPQVGVSEKPSNVDDVHSGIEQIRCGTGPHGGKGHWFDPAVNEHPPDGPHQTLTREWRTGLVSDEHERVFLVVDRGRTYDLQLVLDPVESGRTDRHEAILAVLRLLNEQDALGEIDVADLQRPDLSRPECG